MKSVFRSICLVIFNLTLLTSAFGAIKTWDGGGSDTNWLTAANWVGDTAPVANDDLVFPATASQFSTNNNFFFLTQFRSITIEGGTYTIAGNPLRLTNGINVTTGVHAVNTAVSLSGSQTFNGGQGAVVTVAVLSNGSNTLTLDGNGSFGIGVISGSGGVIKNGLGASLILSSSGFSGALTVNDGIFVVDANIPNSPVTVNATTTTGGFGISGLGGTGTVGATNVINGGISAGTLDSPTGIFNINGLTVGTGGIVAPKIGGTTAGTGGYDQLNVNGAVNISGSRLAPIPWNNFRPAIGDSFTILNNDGTDAVVGAFNNIPEGSVFSAPLGFSFRVSYLGGTGNDITVTRVNRAGFDFDGDGKSDPSVFNNGVWSVFRSGNSTQTTQQFGLASDKITPADFDGDSRTDYAVFRPSDGSWYILNSRDTTLTAFQFGANGDIPVPNDFDGDGRADATVWRNGIWFYLQSLTNQVGIEQFGSAGDKPLVGDYDGDGIGDLAVYRPAEGTWHILNSANDTYSAFQFGLSTDRPCPADFDGDGKTDFIIFRGTANPSLPDFYIVRSSDGGFQGIQWGIPNDIPTVADYDGDGKADIGIFRPASSDWFWLRSTDLAAGNVQFGNGLPIPSAFVP